MLRQAAARARAKLPIIERVILFGSLAFGTPTPRSDADLLVIVRTANTTREDRTPAVLAALSPLPCPVDLFVLSEEELDRARREGAPLVREALAHGVDLLEPDSNF